MKSCKKNIANAIVIIFFLMLIPVSGIAFDLPKPSTYVPTSTQIKEQKTIFDDPRPVLKNYPLKKVLPKKIYDHLAVDIKEAKAKWEKCVGFKSTDLVGKISPEIKPGKYTWKDVKGNPAFKELMLPNLYERIGPGGPPFADQIPEFEIVPPRQYYWHTRIADATLKNENKTKLDKDGYLDSTSWTAGYPFPKLYGPHKAMQLIYNQDMKYTFFGMNAAFQAFVAGFNKNLTKDTEAHMWNRVNRYSGRVLFPPYGYLDEQAEKQNETYGGNCGWYSPRDSQGMTVFYKYFQDVDKQSYGFMYIPGLRRARVMSGTDWQDKLPGNDQIFDDGYGFCQKASPNYYKYTAKIVEDREFLVWADMYDGSVTYSKESHEYKNIKLERRPCYVVKVTELDPGYIYSDRYLLFDKETFVILAWWTHDQKGRLYFDWLTPMTFHPDMGCFSWYYLQMSGRDHIDEHTTLNLVHMLPALYTRKEINLKTVYSKGK